VVVAGLVGVAAGVGVVAWRSMRWTLSARLELGLLSIGGAAVAGFALALLLAGPVAALIVPNGAMLLGFAAALGSDGGGAGPGAEDDGDPPWWPSFERDLRRYERTRQPTGRR
jgi:hypothetical protein